MEPIVLYDIPGNASKSKSWSPNLWKTRYSLNYKGLPYTTVWVEYLDIASLCKNIGAAPTRISTDGSSFYTLPVIYDPNTKTAISESAAIARYLDKTYPGTPTLIPPETSALHAAFAKAFVDAVVGDLFMILALPSCAQLNPRSEEYWRRTREAAKGLKLEEFAPLGSEKREKHWKGVEDAFSTFAQWLEADGSDRSFFHGQKITFADIIVASHLMWIRNIRGEDSKEWQDVMRWNGGRWARFMGEFEKYEAVDSGVDAKV